MVGSAFLASALVEVPLAVAFLVVGAKLHRRSRLHGQPDLAWFTAFWVGIGTYAAAESAWSLAWLAGADAFAVGLLVLHVKIVAMTAALCGLVVYLLAIHAVDKRLRTLTVAGYGLVLAATETFYSWRSPQAQEPGIWGMRLLYERADVEPWWTLLLVVLLLPPFVATLSYGALLRQARDTELRWRIALTSGSLLLFFVPMFLGWRVGGSPWWGGVEKALATLMALGIVLAHWPPPGVRRWIAGAPARDARAEAALIERARQLV